MGKLGVRAIMHCLGLVSIVATNVKAAKKIEGTLAQPWKKLPPWLNRGAIKRMAQPH